MTGFARISVGEATQFADDVTTPPTVAGGETSAAALKSGGASHKVARVRIGKASGAGAVTLTGPVSVYGKDGADWYLAGPGSLNNGADIVVNTEGYAEIVEFVGTWDALSFVPAGVAGGGYDGYIEPIDD